MSMTKEKFENQEKRISELEKINNHTDFKLDLKKSEFSSEYKKYKVNNIVKELADFSNYLPNLRYNESIDLI